MPANTPDTAFLPLVPSSAVDLCAGQLRDRIVSGTLSVGTRLPPERDLAAQFGVNRVTVRSALAQLRAEGLLSVRQGRGYEVQDFQRDSGPSLLPSVLSVARGRSRAELAEWVADMLAARRHLARAVLLEICVRRPDTGGVSRALDTFALAVQAGTSDPRALSALDMDVVRALLEAAGNRVLRLAFNPVLDTLAALPELEEQLYIAPETNVLGYSLLRAWLTAPRREAIEPLLEALAERDRANVARLMARPTPLSLETTP